MRFHTRFFSSLFSFMLSVTAANAGSFTAGNIAVLQADASANNTTASVVELSPITAGQTPSNTIAIDGVTAPNALRFSGSATSTGYLANSQDGSLLLITGHNSTSSGVNANTLLPRGVATFNAAGTFNLAATYTGASGNQTRCATTINNTSFVIGDQGGIYTNGASSASPAGNIRGVRAFGGSLYIGQTATGTIQVSTLSAITGGTITGLPGLANNASLQDFYLISSGSNGATYDVLYTLSATANTAGTIAKYSLVAGTWVANGSYTTTFGGFGLAAMSSGGTGVLFVSTGQGALTANQVLRITDTTGYNAAINIVTANNVALYTAPTGKIIKGVAFAPATAPAITTQPVSQSIITGNTATLSVVASGSAVLSYQWYQGNAGDTSTPVGTNSASFTTPTLTSDSNYWVRVSNAAGSASSNTATITVQTPPSFTTHPASIAISSGTSTTLSVVVTGTPLPTLQWYQGSSGDTSTPVSGETGTNFTTPSLTTTTSYWVRATNAAGAADSNTAVVAVNTILVSVSAPDATAAENPSDTGTFRFTRSGATTSALNVSYSITGAATAADYTPALSGSVTIPVGQSFVDVIITPTDDVLLEGDETVTLSALDTVDYDLGATTSASVTISDNEADIDLSRYVRVGRYALPHPTTTTPPAAFNLLCQEASSVTYNWDTDTLFVVGDGGTGITQVSKAGAYIDSMTFASGSSPQGTEFYDTEGVTYIGGGQFVLTEERDRQLVKFTYVPNTTLTRGATQTVKIGTTIGNIGLEGLCYDPQTSGATPGFIVVKEMTPKGIFQTNVDFTAGTATNGSPTTVNSTDLFAPSLLSVVDHSDVFALSNLPVLAGKPASSHLLIISQESGQIVHCDRAGTTYSTMTITKDVGDVLSVAAMTMEGVTMDRNGLLYIVNENGGGDANHPQLWVYAPTTATNAAPTAIALSSVTTSLPENTPTTAAVKLADITVTDDGIGTNALSVSGADAASFEVVGTALFLKAGTVLSQTTKPSYSISVNVDDATVGTTPDASAAYALTITAATTNSSLIISEVAPWSSGSGTLGSDWFEVTNTGTTAVDITNWKVDDSAPSFATAVPLSGITSIAPGESVIFIETATPADLTAKATTFKNIWFGGNAPSGLQIGSYSGSGIGLSTGGDAVNLYNAGGIVQASVNFGIAPAASPFATFDNAAGLNNTTISALSAVGVNGAFQVTDGTVSVIGSPGAATVGATPIINIIATDATASETAPDTGTFQITRTGSTVSALTVIYTIGGTASSGDYTPALSGSLTIPSGQASVNIVITPVDDVLLEGSETLTLSITDTGSYDVGSNGSATMTILDNETNLAPTAVTLTNKISFLNEATSTASNVKIADITVTDDGFGTNTLSLSGSDASSFTLVGNALYLAAGTTLNRTAKSAYNVTVNVDDASVGTTPDASTNHTLTITQFVPAGTIVISEVSPWSSTAALSSLAADWFEVTNKGTITVDLTGWKMDDNSHIISAAVTLNGITSIAPGESVIFIESAAPATIVPAFKSLWFGASPPAGLQVGTYTGSGVGLSSTADEVTLFDATGAIVTGVGFGASPTGSVLGTFDNAASAGSSTLPFPILTTLSVVGTNGAFLATDNKEIGSPGCVSSLGGWRQTYFGTTSNTGSAADTADFDGDGVPNLLEYALGMNPTSSTGANGLAALPVAVNGSAADQPLIQDRLYLSLAIPATAPADVTYTVQATDSPGGPWTDVARKVGTGAWTWLGGGSVRLYTSVQAPYELVQVGDAVSRTGNDRRFMRLMVSTP